MTEDWFGFDNLLGTGWYNTEYRTFEFLPVSPNEPNPHFSIREAEWSRLRRQEKSDTGKGFSENTEKILAGRPGVAVEVEVEVLN